MSDRTCPSCGETKDEKDFWSGARRCRSCVAYDTGERRSRRAKESRARIQREYDLTVSVSERHFNRLKNQATRAADSLIPKTRRDQVAQFTSRLATYSVVGAFVVPIFLLHLILGVRSDRVEEGIRPAIFAILLVVAFALGQLAKFLNGPRQQAVNGRANILLREALAQAEAFQLEYLQFYRTPEWRQARDAVMRRDGRVCRSCCQHIAIKRDITVDHILPRSKYPELALDLKNLQVMCRRCNSSKGAKV